MGSKYHEQYRRDYRARKREEAAARISRADQEALELMGKLRPHTYGAQLGGDHPRAVARRALMTAIDDMAGVITGDREYFFAKHHSLRGGLRKAVSRSDPGRSAEKGTSEVR